MLSLASLSLIAFDQCFLSKLNILAMNILKVIERVCLITTTIYKFKVLSVEHTILSLFVGNAY